MERFSNTNVLGGCLGILRSLSYADGHSQLFAPRAQQGEGAARLRAAPARARRGRLSIKKTPMTGTPPSTWAEVPYA